MIEFQNVSRVYGEGEAQVHALRCVDWTIQDGEFVCLQGASGSGKSTLLNLLGLIDSPTDGVISINGTDIALLTEEKKADFRNQNFGFVFQGFNLVPVLSSIENVMLPMQIAGVSAKDAKARAQEILTEVGLGNELDRRPDKISGGQRQRVAIARALVNEPNLVIADEPTANLDSATADEIVSLMKNLNRAKGTTFVLSTHDPDLSLHASTNYYIRDGKFEEPVTNNLTDFVPENSRQLSFG